MLSQSKHWSGGHWVCLHTVEQWSWITTRREKWNLKKSIMLLLVNFTTLRRLPLLWWASRITIQKPNSTQGYSPYLHGSFKLSLPICESAKQPQFSEWVPACNDETVTKAHRFSISISTVSRIFHKWLDVTYTRVAKYIRWPDRETLSKNSSCCLSKTLSTSLMHNWLLWNIYRKANFIQSKDSDIFKLQETQYCRVPCWCYTDRRYMLFIIMPGWPSVRWETDKM